MSLPEKLYVVLRPVVMRALSPLGDDQYYLPCYPSREKALAEAEDEDEVVAVQKKVSA